MKQRLVHIASGREWRGGQRQVWLLARALARQGVVTQVVVTGRGSELARRLSDDGIPTITPEWTGAFDLRVLAATLRAATSGAVLHAHDSHALALAGLVSHLRPVMLVATRRVDVPLGRTWFWRRADRVIAVSGAVGDVLRASGIDPDRIAVVHSGINVEEVAGIAPHDPRPDMGLTRGTPLVLTTGALVKVKDHATLIRAAAIAHARRPDLHWAIAGEGYLRPSLEALIADLGMGDSVHLLGHVPEAARLVARSDLFVMSSVREGLGTSVLDAMALGIPVVGTRIGGIPELLGGGAGALVAPQDPDGMAGAVLTLLNEPSNAAANAARARIAVERYSDERMAEGVLQVYRSLTSAH